MELTRFIEDRLLDDPSDPHHFFVLVDGSVAGEVHWREHFREWEGDEPSWAGWEVHAFDESGDSVFTDYVRNLPEDVGLARAIELVEKNCQHQ